MPAGAVLGCSGTFFVEYQMPVMGARGQTSLTEVMRIACKKMKKKGGEQTVACHGWSEIVCVCVCVCVGFRGVVSSSLSLPGSFL